MRWFMPWRSSRPDPPAESDPERANDVPAPATSSRTGDVLAPTTSSRQRRPRAGDLPAPATLRQAPREDAPMSGRDSAQRGREPQPVDLGLFVVIHLGRLLVVLT
jgi:hypothetical protein